MLNCPAKGPAEIWAGKNQFTNAGGDPSKGIKFTRHSRCRQSQLTVLQQLEPEHPSVAFAVLKDSIDSLRSHPISVPVIHIEATSTSVVRVPLRIVPAYTLAVDPQQAVEVLNAPHKSFDVLLRIHSYSTKTAKVSVGLDAPDGFHASAPINLSFNGIGDQYAKVTATPPAKLAAGNFPLTAYVKRGEEKFATSLDPLPSMPTILWSEPAQCLVHAFDINVPRESARRLHLRGRRNPFPTP